MGSLRALGRDCSRHKFAEFARAIQAFAGWIRTQLLRESFDVVVYFIVEQVAHIGRYPSKAAWIGQIIEAHHCLLWLSKCMKIPFVRLGEGDGRAVLVVTKKRFNPAWCPLRAQADLA